MDCEVIVMNANGCVPKDLKIGGMGIPKKRKDARQKVIKDENPDLILIQESDIALKNICTQDFGYRDYQSIGGKDAGIIYDTTTFIQLEDPTNRLRQIYEFKCFTGEISSGEILPRMCAVIPKGKNPNANPFLCVSWHCPYKKNILQKINLFYDLCLLIKIYLPVNEKQISVILGGDFNLDLSALIPITMMLPPPVFHHLLILNDYRTLDHRPNKTDYILTSLTIINVSCKPIHVFDTINDLFPDLPLKYNKAVLVHDPLVVKVTIPNQMGWVSTPLQNNILLPNQPTIFGL